MNYFTAAIEARCDHSAEGERALEMYDQLLEFILLGGAGAAAGELLKLYELRGKLPSKRYRALSKNPAFWCLVLGMVSASGFVAWAINASVDHATPLQVVMSGLGARALARGVAEGGAANRSLKAGPTESSWMDALS